MQSSPGVMDGHGGKQGGVRERLLLAGVFAAAALRYWLTVFPGVYRQLARWRRRAGGIADPVLRGLALDALDKSGNIEGAAAFATFVPRSHRQLVLRAAVAFQTAYNYLDLLSELPSADPPANARRLHEALLVALDWVRSDVRVGTEGSVGAGSVDYYEYNQQHDDGGYLSEIVEECRATLAVLPSYAAVAPSARRAASRIVEFQSLSAGEPAKARRATEGALAVADGPGVTGRPAVTPPLRGSYGALERWAREQTPAESGLQWWETVASAGSSLCVYALIAAAARPRCDVPAVAQIEQAYFPWIGALHSLLDNLVDVAEDHATGQHNLIGCYPSALEATTRMRLLAERSLRAARGLPGDGDSLILAAMASFYLSTPEASLPAARPVARAVLEVLGKPAALAGLVFRLRRLAWARRRKGAEVLLGKCSQLAHEFVK
jgi:tetraprenyl-beta-curcumene synthase